MSLLLALLQQQQCETVWLHAQADKIEMQKLKAIGVRNAVATLEEVMLITKLTGDSRCIAIHTILQDKKRILKEAQAQLSDKQQRLER